METHKSRPTHKKIQWIDHPKTCPPKSGWLIGLPNGTARSFIQNKKLHNEPYILEWHDLWQLQPYSNTSAIGIRERGWVPISVGKNCKCQF
jgi:hypothetical protein